MVLFRFFRNRNSAVSVGTQRRISENILNNVVLEELIVFLTAVLTLRVDLNGIFASKQFVESYQ